jgi:cobalt-zinc-cadmium efflux system protein
MASMEGVVGIHDLHVWSITSGMPALSGHVVVTDAFLGDSDRMLNRIKRMLEDKFGICHTTLQVESERYEEVGEIHALDTEAN